MVYGTRLRIRRSKIFVKENTFLPSEYTSIVIKLKFYIYSKPDVRAFKTLFYNLAQV